MNVIHLLCEIDPCLEQSHNEQFRLDKTGDPRVWKKKGESCC